MRAWIDAVVLLGDGLHLAVGDVVCDAFLFGHVLPGIQVHAMRIDRAGQMADEMDEASHALRFRIDHLEMRCVRDLPVRAGKPHPGASKEGRASRPPPGM